MLTKIPVLLLIFNLGCQPDGSNRQIQQPQNSVAVAQAGGIDRHPDQLQYTRHARCRMGCRHITTNEIKDILLHGSVNNEKSDLHDKPCATYALEGYTLSDHQHVRIIFAQCDHVVKVVTCIDLDHDFACNCR